MAEIKEEPVKLRLDIDLHHLEIENANQPKQREYFGRLLADAQKDFDDLKAALAVTRARIDTEVRQDPQAFELTKVTETTVENAVLLDRRHQEAVQKLNEARHRVGVLEAAVEGLVDRKKSLTNLVELHGQEYFAAPSGSRSRQEEEDVDGSMPKGVRGRRRREEGDD